MTPLPIARPWSAREDAILTRMAGQGRDRLYMALVLSRPAREITARLFEIGIEVAGSELAQREGGAL